MPGMLIIEAMAQASAFIIGSEGFQGFLTSIYNAQFKKSAAPGDILVLESEFMQRVKNLVRVKATAKVNGEIAVKAHLGFIIIQGKLSNEK
jgi:3-hydroxyacyl-[acyl-carrier-protein] dehydratase